MNMQYVAIIGFLLLMMSSMLSPQKRALRQEFSRSIRNASNEEVSEYWKQYVAEMDKILLVEPSYIRTIKWVGILAIYFAYKFSFAPMQ